jgi:hypothetical protein
VGEAGEAVLGVGRDQRDEDAEDDQQPGDAGGDDRQLHRALAVEDPGPQQHPEDDQGDGIEGVVEGDEGDHPPRHVAARHPRLAQGPVGDGDAARPAGREEQGPGDPGHVDLVGLFPGQTQRVAADHRLEEGDVGRVGEDVEADRDADPERVGLVEPVERVAEPDHLREEEVDRPEQDEDDDDGLDQPARRENRHFGEATAPVRRVFRRHVRQITRWRSSPDAGVPRSPR